MANQTLFVIFVISNNISHMFAIQFNCHQNINALFRTYSIAFTFIVSFYLLLWPLQAYISSGDKDIYMDTMTIFNIIQGICRMSGIIFVSMDILFDAIFGTHIRSTFTLLAIIIIIFTTLSLFYSPNRPEIDSLSTNIDNFNDLTPINDVNHDTDDALFLNRDTNDGMYNAMNTIQYKQPFILWLSQLYVWYSPCSVILSTKHNSINTNSNDWLQFNAEVKPLFVKPSIPLKFDDSIVTSHEFVLGNQYTQQICLLHGSNVICYDTQYFILGEFVNNGYNQQALEVYDHHKINTNINTDNITYYIALIACINSKDFNSGHLIHKTLILSDENKNDIKIKTQLIINKHVTTYVMAIKACGKLKDKIYKHKIYKQQIPEKYRNNIQIQTALIQFYGQCSDIKNTLNKHIVTINSMLTTYVKNGYNESALQLFDEMNTKYCEIERDNVLYFNSNNFAKGQRIHKEIKLVYVKQIKRKELLHIM